MRTNPRLLAAVALALAVGGTANASAKTSKADLSAATNIVYGDYGKAKFEETLKKVRAKLGPEDKTATNMYSWFAKDGAKCIQFWVTKGSEGFAATGMADDTTDAKTGCK